MNFKSDNTAGVSAEIMAAIQKANHGCENSYGNDSSSKQLKARLCEVFEHDVDYFLTSTGTAANVLALSAITPRYGALFCHEHAHIIDDECGAPFFFTGGSQAMLVKGENGKMEHDELEAKLAQAQTSRPHGQMPGSITITQATESGTVYSEQELHALKNIAQKFKVPMHMDGARFANAVAHLKISPARLTTKVGIDVLSFGGTKNGCLNAEAVIFFNKDYARHFDYIHKQAGQLMSKTRFFSAQFLAYLHNDLWLKNALHANQMATSLAQVFDDAGQQVLHEVQANEVFVYLPRHMAEYLAQNGAGFYDWPHMGKDCYRFVTSSFTEEREVKALKACLKSFSKEAK